MLFSSSVALSIPSPPVSSFQLGPLTIHFYALCILAGIVAAAIMTNHRLTKRGAEPWVVIDICLLAVPLAIIGARIFHVVTHWGFYFGEGKDFWAVFRIWEGGIAIFGALIGGAIGAWLGCKWTGIRFWTFADALAPGLLLAQAMGRFGNWFNQELFGGPTTLPWGLEVDPASPNFPAGYAPDTLFHPTFLYECLWNLAGVALLLLVDRALHLRHGLMLWSYVAWYTAGRTWIEMLRIDDAEMVTLFGVTQRLNVWTSLLVFVIALAFIVGILLRHRGAAAGPHAHQSVWRAGHAPEGDDGAAVAAGRSGSHAVGAAEDDAVRR